MLGQEHIGILLAEKLVQMMAGIVQTLTARMEYREVGQVDDTFQHGHGICIYTLHYHIAHKEELGLTVVHYVMYLLGGKLVLHRHGHGSITQHTQKGYCPVRTVPAAKCYLVATLQSFVFEKYV